MKVTKKTKIAWPKPRMLPPNYFEAMPKALKERGFDVDYLEWWIDQEGEAYIDSKYDLIVCFGPYVTHQMLSKINEKKNLPPKIHHVWDVRFKKKNFESPLDFIYEDLKILLKQNRDKIICYTHDVRKRIKEIYGIDAEVQLSYFDNQIIDAVPEQEKKDQIIIVAHHYPYKNIQLPIMAASLLRQKFSIVLTGREGYLTSMYHKIAKSLGVELKPFVGSHEDVIKEIKKSRVMVYTSAYEGFGIPPKEAVWAGTPAIVSDIQVMREVHGEDMCYVGLASVMGLRFYLHKLLVKKEPLYDMVKAKERLKEYTIEKQADKFADYLLKLEI